MNRRLMLAAAAAMVVGTALAGCTNSSSTATSTPTPTVEPAVPAGGSLTVGVTDGLPVDGWDPVTAPDSTVRTFGPLVMATLLRPAADGSGPSSGTAIAATANSNATVWTITLRSGLTFSDGTPLTSRDIAFGLTQAARQPQLASRFGADAKGTFFVSATATDTATVIVRLRASNAVLDRSVLAAPEFGCVKADFGGLDRAKYFQQPASCGPYVEPVLKPADTTMTLTRNTAYYAPNQVGPDKVAVTSLDTGAAATAFVNGGGDVVIEPRVIPPTALTQLTATPTTSAAVSPSEAANRQMAAGPALVQSSTAGRVNVLLFRAKPPTRDSNLRIAVQAALDDAMLVAQQPGGIPPTSGLVPPGWPGGTAYPVAKNNPALAKTAVSLLDKDATTMTLLVRAGNADAVAQARIIETQAAAVGVTVVVDAATTGRYTRALAAGNFDSALVAIAPRVALAADVTRDWALTGGFGAGWPTTSATAAYPRQLTGPAFGPLAEQATTGFAASVLDPVYAIPLVARPHRALVDPNAVSGVVVRWDGSLPLERVVVGSATPSP